MNASNINAAFNANNESSSYTHTHMKCISVHKHTHTVTATWTVFTICTYTRSGVHVDFFSDRRRDFRFLSLCLSIYLTPSSSSSSPYYVDRRPIVSERRQLVSSKNSLALSRQDSQNIRIQGRPEQVPAYIYLVVKLVLCKEGVFAARVVDVGLKYSLLCCCCCCSFREFAGGVERGGWLCLINHG